MIIYSPKTSKASGNILTRVSLESNFTWCSSYSSPRRFVSNSSIKNRCSSNIARSKYVTTIYASGQIFSMIIIFYANLSQREFPSNSPLSCTIRRAICINKCIIRSGPSNNTICTSRKIFSIVCLESIFAIFKPLDSP
jgi:hypothetical protein